MTASFRTRVLLVDDDADVVWALGRFLTRQGMAVTTCGDGAEAVSLMSTRDFDVVVTDIQMPEINGLALLEWIRQNRPALRVAVMTAFGSPQVHEVVMRKGVALYLEKPVDPDLLVRVINSSGTRDSFSGTVDCIDLFDYVQLVLVTKRQVVLEVLSSAGESGLIYMDGGDVTHAESGELKGEAAFYRCLAFDGGCFTSLPWCAPGERTIRARGDHLLMEAARMKDESSQRKMPSMRPDCFELEFNLRPEGDESGEKV